MDENDFFTGKWDGCGLNFFQGFGDRMASNSISSGFKQNGFGLAGGQGESNFTGGIRILI